LPGLGGVSGIAVNAGTVGEDELVAIGRVEEEIEDAFFFQDAMNEVSSVSRY
jgi:hypothetical protein